MTLITFAQVFIVCLLGAMSPGPSMAVVINNAIFKGRYNGIITSIGHGIGIAVYATFAVLGLGLIIKTNIFIFNSLKILSIIFLIFIGVKSIDEISFKMFLSFLATQNLKRCDPHIGMQFLPGENQLFFFDEIIKIEELEERLDSINKKIYKLANSQPRTGNPSISQRLE